MPITLNSKEYSCRNCDKFQRADGEVWDGTGECRALPPAQCCVLPIAPEKIEPIFAQIAWAPATWCAAWKRLIGAELPDPVAIPE